MQQEERVTQGTLRTSTGEPLPLEHTDVKAHLAGPVARVEVKQVFHNPLAQPIEAVYLFPLPHEASVYAMRFRIGARVVEAVVKEKEEAKRAYEAARREGRSATLLEQDRPNLFTLSVANIPPGEKIEVELSYQERLAFDEGELRFVFPMVAAERYHAGTPDAPPGKGHGALPTTEVPDAPRIRPPRASTGQRPADISIALTLHADVAAGEPRSPSHHVIVEPRGPGHFHIRLHEGDSLPNRDFVIAYQATKTQGVRPRAYFERKPDRIGTFLLLVTPPVSHAEDLPDAERDLGGTSSLRCTNCGGALRDPGAVREHPGIGQAFRCVYCGVVVAVSREGARVGLPRDVIFLVDRSCSMRGGSLPQARRAVRMILDHLGPDDAVQCFAFDHERIPADGIGRDFRKIGPEAVAQVDALLAGLAARGGTELEEALERAAMLEERKDRARLVVLITDAALGNEGRLLRRVPEILGPETRLYVLGVGPAVNRYLVERLARAGGGASDVLLPGEDVEAVVPRFARRVRQGGPVLRKLKLAWDDALPVDVYPNPIPDLFGGQTVQLLGRFSGSGKSRLVLLGERATGEPYRQEIDVDLPEAAEDISGIERMWARLRIDARLARLAEAPGEAAEVRLEVLSLALKHALLSPYTALVAEDSEKRVEGPAKRVEVPVMAAAEHLAEEEESERAFADDEEELRTSVGSRGDEEMYMMSEPLMARSLDVDDDDDMPVAARSRESAAEGGRGGGGGERRSYTLGGSSGGERTRSGVLRSAPDPAVPAPAARPAAAAPPPAFGGPPSPAPAAPMAAAPPPPTFAPSGAASPRRDLADLDAPFSELDGARLTSTAAPRKKGGLLSKIVDFFSGDAEAPEEAAAGAPEPVALPKPPPPVAPPPPRTPAAPPRPPPPPAQQAQAPRGASAPGSEAYTPEMLAYVAQKGVGELDLVFLVDETGSMGEYIEQVKRRLLEIIDALRAAPLCRSLRLGLVSYRDHPPQERSFVSRAVPLTSDADTIRKGVERMAASGGGDGPEAVTDGLHDLVSLDWRPRAARVVVWVGDAPPHGVEPSGDGFPGGCPCGHHWYTQAESCREMGIVVHAVGCLPTLREYAGAEDVFKTVARTTRGLYLPLSEAPLLIPLITGVAEAELDKQRIEELIAEVLTRHETQLQKADQQERVRFVTDVLRDRNVRPRRLVYRPDQPTPPPLRFAEIMPTDVEEGLDQLRRLGRTTL